MRRRGRLRGRVDSAGPVTRLLVVDDHPAFRSALRELLERAGYDVVGEASDGASAVVTAEALSPEAVLLDVGLPDSDGFDVCEELAASGIAVVMMSSRGRADFADRLAVTSARGFLSKGNLTPTAVDQLLS